MHSKTICFGRPRFNRLFSALVLTLSAGGVALAAGDVVKLDVDAREAPRKIIHARMEIPVSPGAVTLCYPKWLPGEHGPTGPVLNLAGLKMSAAGKPISWRRDLEDMFAFHCDAPAGTQRLDLQLDYLSPSGTEGFTATSIGSAKLAVINWNLVLLYPKGKAAGEQMYEASLQLPAGWKFGTALEVARQSDKTVQFKPVSLSMLIDSPVVIGAYYRDVNLTPGKRPEHHIDIVADSAAALAIPDEREKQYRRLVAETGALFGARHYDRYHFLLTLSDHVAYFGLEHHQSSDDRMGERLFLEKDQQVVGASLLPHEFFHSWNGKYRRPVDLTTGNFDEPMKTDLLWVYEGLTEYYGSVLTARSGLWTAKEYREHLASVAANLDHRPGRTWRPLQDTADFAQQLYNAGFGGPWATWRREVDFYDEGELIWLDADVLIRRQTNGKRSLDDFCKRFHGGKDGLAGVKPYTFDDVVATMNEVSAYDWKGFFTERLTATGPRAPLGGVTGAGWSLEYNATSNDYIAAAETAGKGFDLGYSLGLSLKEDGGVQDATPGMPAYEAGIGPGMKLIAVNGRRWTRKVMEQAIESAKEGDGAMELLAESGDYFSTHRLNYHEGAKNPHLARDEAKEDLLTKIISSKAK